jgi:hypothetical protein
MHARTLAAAIGLALSLAAAGCKTAGDSSQTKDLEPVATAGRSAPPGELATCAALRGNGDLIFAHFAALARYTEHYGMLDALAGGSSGSITTFLYESMALNPALRRCGKAACRPEQVAGRMALLLKSVEGYANYLGNTETAVAIRFLAPIAKLVQAEGVEALIAAGDPKARDALLRVLTSPDIAALINREMVTILRESKKPLYHAQEAMTAIRALADWGVSDQRIFFRPGAVNFQAVAKMVGRVGNFYAGYAPADVEGQGRWLDQCAEPARGKSWAALAALPGPDGRSCGESLDALLKVFHTTLLADEAAFRSRVDDPIGLKLPALVTTSILEGAPAMARLEEARRRYLAGQDPALQIDWDMIRFGYWGRPADLERIAADPRGFGDPKTKKFLALGTASWREILSYSPAEPSLARILALSDTRASAGGWSDLHPTLVLKNLGCKDVVYFSRRGNESEFAVGVARHFGLSDADEKALYDLDTMPKSSHRLSLENASVWCTDWNAYATQEFGRIFQDSYNAPFEARSERFRGGANRYPNVVESTGLRGCTPGAPK